MKNNVSNSNVVMGIFKKIYAHHGVPDVLITDRGTPFTKFQELLNPSTLAYPKSNGVSERSVHSIKLYLNSEEGNAIFVQFYSITTPFLGTD